MHAPALEITMTTEIHTCETCTYAQKEIDANTKKASLRCKWLTRHPTPFWWQSCQAYDVTKYAANSTKNCQTWQKRI